MMISIGNRKIGAGEPCFIIAEAGVNHNGDPECARKLIDAAVEAQADAIKFQTFIAEILVTPSAQKAEYQKIGSSASTTQFQMLKSLELSEPVFKKLAAYAKKKGILFLSTAFDEESLELLFRLHVPVFKIPSGEITNFPFLAKIAEQKKPVILSTGMSTMAEVKDAVSCLREHGCKEIVILHCTTSYPAPPESVNLRAMNTLREEFRLPVGYSDHTAGISITIAAVAMGACVIEKHFTLDRTLPGPDHAASLEPEEFRQMVRAVRDVESAAGNGKKDIQACEVSIRAVVRKSIVAAKNIAPGALISEDMLTIKRPGSGIEPGHIQEIIGKTAPHGILKDTVITWDMIE